MVQWYKEGEERITFSDVSLLPMHTFLNSRFDSDPYIDVDDYHILPLIAANMSSISTEAMAFSLYDQGVLVPIHRFQSIENQVRTIKALFEQKHIRKRVPIAATVGLNDGARSLALSKYVDWFFLELAHADSNNAILEVKRLKKSYPDKKLVVGNVGTKEACKRLYDAGADFIKVGISSGSPCSTFLVTGCYVPQLSAVLACEGYPIISDGGHRDTGDILKSLSASAAMVMVGSLLAGTDESEGQGTSTRRYSGMASKAAQIDRDGRFPDNIVPEGISVDVPYKGSAKQVIKDLEAGIRQGMAMLGVRTIKELRENVIFQRLSSSAKIEGSPHILNRS